MNCSSRFLLLVPLLCAALTAAPACATDGWQLRGFSSVGATRGDDPDLGFRRDLSRARASTDGEWEWQVDSLLGLQLNRQFGEDFDIAVQAVLRDRAPQSLADSIEWAFLRYRAGADTELRIGRMGTDVFMLSDYRNVGYAYPWIRPMPDFYGFVPLFSFDGIDAVHRIALGDGILHAKAYGGVSTLGLPQPDAASLRLHIRPILGASLLYEREGWRARLSHTRATLKDDLPLAGLPLALEQATPLWPEAATLAERLRRAGSRTRYSTAGISYNGEHWLLQGELSRIDSDSELTPRARAGYLSGGRRFGAFTAFATVSKAEPLAPAVQIALPSDLPPPVAAQLEPLRAGTEAVLNGVRVDQRGRGLGLRWDVAPQKALTLQWDRWHVAGDGTLLWEVGSGFDGRARDVDVIGFSFDVVF